MKNELPVIRYTCPKCGGKKYEAKGVIIQQSQFSQIFSTPGYPLQCCDLREVQVHRTLQPADQEDKGGI